ncbi:SCO family protein [Anaeromyxobacter oryzae]|uniref:Electron transporter SenC n=1 Tax=Anaeromyxobacter oryzae TaxID=2918170 RepID=A0ABN6MU72_9BACT|nr:SCO family protein [Anaeromyxobacter oryzae]BDG04476.1 electron transporter SenC [Anaeromyxobacter oryzae]
MIRPAAALALAALAAAAPARAQYRTDRSANAPPIQAQPMGLEEVRIEEKLAAPVPLDTTFTDWRGRTFTLRKAFAGNRPVILTLVYYDCPMLCGLILSGLAKTMRENGLVLGKDYDAVTISFDPDEKPAMAAERRRGYLQSLGRQDSGAEWPFLVGTGQASRAVADAVGFYYKKDDRTGEWAHMAAVLVLTPDGKVSRYLYGIEYPSKEFRLSVVEAAGGKVGTSFDRFLLTCYRYDPASRKYEPYAIGIMRAGALAVLLGLSGLIGGLVWRERRGKARHAP